ncbi:MAG: FUSC family protein [Solirubrobacterales bacterium]|nr:FUSC family protein [Solirubrobacterales bacterium]
MAGLRPADLPDWRPAAVTMAAVLGSWLTSWAMCACLKLPASQVNVLVVAMALSASRSLARPTVHPYLGWARLLALPLIGAGASLLAHHTYVCDAVFVLVMAGAQWVRRFGPLETALALLLPLPLVATLVVPGGTLELAGASAAGGLIALCWATGTQWLSVRLNVSGSRAAFDAAREAHSRLLSHQTQRAVPDSTRIAVQLAVALAGAIALGRFCFGAQWAWPVLGAYLVMAGNQGRGDVVHNAIGRLVGALSGTALATLLSGDIPAGKWLGVVLMFVVIALAGWLRDRAYAFWTTGVTAVLALLYGFSGHVVSGVLVHRLVALVAGAVIAIFCSWFLLPVHSGQTFSRAWSDALGAAARLLTLLADKPTEREAIAAAQERFELVAQQVRALEPTWRLHQRFRPEPDHPADRISALSDIEARLDELAAMAPAALSAHQEELDELVRGVGTMRRRLRGG